MLSIIIPTFKRRDMLFQAIEKIYEQTYNDFEIIVINDDIKDDPTDEIVNIFSKVKYIKYPHKISPGKKREIGLDLSVGEFIYAPDDDDYLIDKFFFEIAINILKNDDSISFVSGSSIIKYENEKDETKAYMKKPLNVNGLYNGLEYLEHMQSKYMKPLSSFPTLFRRSVFQSNLFDEKIEMNDVLMYMLASLKGNAYFIENYVGVYRVHSRSLTTKKSSVIWINDLLRQKELIFEYIKDKITDPELWWARHVAMTYNFFANTSKNRKEKFNFLRWIYAHNHGYVKVNKFLIKSFIRLLFNR